MVKVLILYYLSIKQTHGYEIQKFIQMSGFDVWANIKMGSIYYALNKLEQEKKIKVIKEISKEGRTRKIYTITELGKKELNKSIELELNKSIIPLNLDKFIIPITFNKIDKDKVVMAVDKQVKILEEKLKYWEYWMEKRNFNEYESVEKVSFEMTICNIKNAIRWYKAMVKDFDYYHKKGEEYENLIASFICEEDNDIDEVKLDSTEELRTSVLNQDSSSKGH